MQEQRDPGKPFELLEEWPVRTEAVFSGLLLGSNCDLSLLVFLRSFIQPHPGQGESPACDLCGISKAAILPLVL